VGMVMKMDELRHVGPPEDLVNRNYMTRAVKASP
jgi:hypothetical protein